MRSRSPALLAAALVLLGASLPSRGEEPAPPLTVPFLRGRPFAEALAKAKAGKKLVMMDVYAVWCGPCKMMDAMTFSNAAVGEFVKQNFVPVKVDAEKGEGRRLGQRYMVNTFPTILFLDASGNEIDRLVAVFGPDGFIAACKQILGGKTPLLENLARLKKSWQPQEAAGIAQELIRRNDVPRLHPIAVRLISEEDDLGSPDGTLQLLTALTLLEDFGGRVDPETADLAATFLPRAGNDARRGALAAALAREDVRRGDTAAARDTVRKTLAVLGDGTPYASDLWAALGAAERKAGQSDAAIAALKKASDLAEAANYSPTARGERQMDLAEAVQAAGRTADAKAAMEASLARWGNDPKASVRASKLALAMKEKPEAVAHARRAVALSGGEDPAAQAALAAALTATGDKAGAATAWKRAAELDPSNPEYRRETPAASRKKPAAGAS